MNSAAARAVVSEASQTAEARRVAHTLAGRIGFDQTKAAQVALAATEAATNLLKHAGRGEILFQILTDSGGAGGLEMLVLDKGPGIKNVGESLRDGYSTAGSAGTGMGAMSRLAARFDVYSQVGKGTAVFAQFWPKKRAAEPAFEIGGISVAVEGEQLCGDAWSYYHSAGGTSIFVADGLGHGHLAATAAREAVTAFEANEALQPIELLSAVHNATRNTRGAAVAIASIGIDGKCVRFSGVGNISGALIGPSGIKHMVSMSGIIGHEVRTFREFDYPWEANSLMVLHSDGVGTRWDLGHYPGLRHKPCALIAGVLWRDSVRERDDSTVIVARQAAEQ